MVLTVMSKVYINQITYCTGLEALHGISMFLSYDGCQQQQQDEELHNLGQIQMLPISAFRIDFKNQMLAKGGHLNYVQNLSFHWRVLNPENVDLSKAIIQGIVQIELLNTITNNWRSEGFLFGFSLEFGFHRIPWRYTIDNEQHFIARQESPPNYGQ